MVLADITISFTTLIILTIVIFIFVLNIIFFYVISKKIKTKVKDTKEYKKEFVKLKKLSLKEIEDVKKSLINKDSPINKYNILNGKSKMSLDYWKTWYLDKFHGSKVVLINMELTNGFHRLFLVKEKDEGFVFRGKKYIFDDDSKYYNIDTKLYVFDYHEQITLPFKRKFPVTNVKKTIESTEGIDTEYAINPATLQRFMTAKIAEGVMRGTQLDEFMKKLQMFLIVTMIATLTHLIIFLYASGILQNLKIPGIIG